MVLNNEKVYVTNEKLTRYTLIKINGNTVIMIQKLVQENVRYLISTFVPTDMIYITSFRQINYIASWMKDFINNYNIDDDFENKLANYMIEFIDQLEELNIIENRFLYNEKHKSLISKNFDNKKEIYDDIYQTKYKGSFAKYNHYLKDDINNYTKDARCTYPNYNCLSDCGFNKGKTLKRTI
ncbi:MAG: hypothetical protein ACK5HL_04195 [Bacilli bacterium]